MARKIAFGAVVAALLLACVPESPKLTLVGTINVPAHFVAKRSAWASSQRVFLAGEDGKLYVYGRGGTFPQLSVITMSGSSLTTVRGDENFVLVVAEDGWVFKYTNEDIPQFDTAHFVGFATSQLELSPEGDRFYVSLSDAELAVNNASIFLSQMNEGEVAYEIYTSGFVYGNTYGTTAHELATQRLVRGTGSYIAHVANPGSAAANLFADDAFVVQTTPGCCGTGYVMRSSVDLSELLTETLSSANVVLRRGDDFIVGRENGLVNIVSVWGAHAGSAIALRQVTGHTGPEDIEIRSIWTDDVDDYVFAASSWNGDLDVPSFFVLQVSE